MLEVFIGVMIFVLAFLGGVLQGYLLFSKPRPQSKIEVHVPPIEIKQQAAPQPASTNWDDRIQEYEKSLEEARSRDVKAEQMTEEYIDLNSQAQQIMDEYLNGGPVNGRR